MFAVYGGSRRNPDAKAFSLGEVNGVWRLAVDGGWLASHSLTEYELGEEAAEWRRAGVNFEVLSR